MASHSKEAVKEAGLLEDQMVALTKTAEVEKVCCGGYRQSSMLTAALAGAAIVSSGL